MHNAPFAFVACKVAVWGMVHMWSKTWSNFGFRTGNNQSLKGIIFRKDDRMLFPKIRCVGLFKSHVVQLGYKQINCLAKATYVGDSRCCKKVPWAKILARPIIYFLSGTMRVIYNQCLVTVLCSLGLGDDLDSTSRQGSIDQQDFSLKKTV